MREKSNGFLFGEVFRSLMSGKISGDAFVHVVGSHFRLDAQPLKQGFPARGLGTKYYFFARERCILSFYRI
jgi:hypothetical protein